MVGRQDRRQARNMQPNDFASITTLPRFLPPPPPAPAPPSDAAAHNATGTVQNLLLGLGVLALTVSAVSLVATNWAHFGASVRGGMLVGLTLLLGGLAWLARRREMGGTSAALASLTVLLGFVDLRAIQLFAFRDARTDAYLAIAGLVLAWVLATFHRFVPGLPVRIAMAMAWLMASWSGLARFDVKGPDLYALPFAMLIVAITLLTTRDAASASSWDRYGLALIVGFGPAVLTALADPNLLRPLIVLVVAATALVVGVSTRQRAPIAVGACGVGALSVMQLARISNDTPGWVVFGIVGAVLLVAGATFEWQRNTVALARSAYRTFH